MALLLHVLGDQALKVYFGFTFTSTDDNRTVDEILVKFDQFAVYLKLMRHTNDLFSIIAIGMKAKHLSHFLILDLDVKATALTQQISHFYSQILSTKASYHIYTCLLYTSDAADE